MLRRIYVFGFLVFFVGCLACIQFPKRVVDKKGEPLYPESCYRYEVCMYYVAAGKLTSDCKLELEHCRKDVIYGDCGNDATRWKGQREQDCWNIKD